MIRNANELTPLEKATIEKLLGRTIHDNESISIHAFEQPQISPQQKLELLDGPQRYFAEIDQVCVPSSDLEYEEAFGEAMRSVRPNYRPHR